MGSKQMKKRIFCGSVCHQIVYNVPDGARSLSNYDPERKKRSRFKDEAEYQDFKERIAIRKAIRRFNAAFAVGDIYITLTFDDDWEVHTFEEARKVRRNFIRVLQWAYPEAVIWATMGRGKSTNRIHFHMVVHGIPESFLREKWKYGSVIHVRPLREHNYYNGKDHGADFTALALYLLKHWTKEQGGHRFFMTKNARKPEAEEATEVKLGGGYSQKRPPKPPKGYMLVDIVSTIYGHYCFKYVVIPELDRRGKPPKNPVSGPDK